jgi:hypothetical protein
VNTPDFAWRPVVVAVNAVQRVLIRHQSLYRLLFVDALEPFRWGISRHRAAYLARRAQQRGSGLHRPLSAQRAPRHPGQRMGSDPSHRQGVVRQAISH